MLAIDKVMLMPTNELVLTRAQVRRVDGHAIDQWGMSGLVLMENAGRGVADRLCQLGIHGPVVVACAGGNNGGDGFVVARHLDLRGYRVEVVLGCDLDELRGDAAVNHAILAKTDVPIRGFCSTSCHDLLAGADWVVDALLGTGASGDPRPPLDRVIAGLNDSPAKKMAVDVPSGLDCDTGEGGTPVFRADHTCTFVAAKPGLLVRQARDDVGQLHVLDIGVPRKLIAQVCNEIDE